MRFGLTTAFLSVFGPILQVPAWWCICMVSVWTQHAQYWSVPYVRCLQPGTVRVFRVDPNFWNEGVLFSSMAILIPSTIRYKSTDLSKKFARITGLEWGLAFLNRTCNNDIDKTIDNNLIYCVLLLYSIYSPTGCTLYKIFINWRNLEII